MKEKMEGLVKYLFGDDNDYDDVDLPGYIDD